MGRTGTTVERNATPPSTGTKEAVSKRSRGLWSFYIIVMSVLVLMTGLSVCKYLAAPVTRVELAGFVISTVSPGTLTLPETKVTKAITLGPGTEISVNGQKATAAELKPGMTAKITWEPDSSKASRIDATGK